MFWQYVTGYTNYWGFLDTFAYNFGLLYDSVVSGLEDLYGGDDLTPNYFMVGYSIGNIVYLVFFTE